MPGLMRSMVRTAAVVGTATATRNAVNRRQAEKNVAAYTNAMQQAAPPAPVEYSDPPMQQDDMISKLERLGALYAQGLLTEQEFAAQKAQLLGT
jgi:hypothetical protein